MTGVRAYERRGDLRAYNQRLLDYAAAGGTVIVQYNKFEFNEAPVRALSRQGGPRPRDRRERAGEAAGSPRTRCSTRRTRSAAPTGTAGCRSAGCTSSAPTSATRDTDLLEMADRSRTTRVPSAARSSSHGRQGPLDLRRAGALAPVARRHRRRVWPDGQPPQPGPRTRRDVRAEITRSRTCNLHATRSV